VSYLLEALKRLEERRQNPESSDLLTVQGHGPREVKRRAVWPYVLSAALLVNAGAAVWLLGPWRTSSPRASIPITADPVRKIQSPGASPPAQAESPHDNGNHGVGPTDEPANQIAPAKPSRPITSPPVERANVATGEVKKSSVPRPADERLRSAAGPALSPASVTPTTSPAAGSSAGAGQSPPTKNEALELRLSLHSYSTDPKSRLVRIDDRTVKEGDTLATGVTVEEITPDGVIINNKGSKVHLKVQN
jgi:general secretion pathway protein B